MQRQQQQRPPVVPVTTATTVEEAAAALVNQMANMEKSKSIMLIINIISFDYAYDALGSSTLIVSKLLGHCTGSIQFSISPSQDSKGQTFTQQGLANETMVVVTFELLAQAAALAANVGDFICRQVQTYLTLRPPPTQ